MQKTGQQSNLAERLQLKLEAERLQVEEITAKELKTLAANLKKTSEDALNSIQNDINDQLNGLMPSLKTVLKPIIWIVLGSMVLMLVAWIILWAVSNTKMNKISVLNQQIELKQKSLDNLNEKIGALKIEKLGGEIFLVFPNQESVRATLTKSYLCGEKPCFKIEESK